MTNGIAKFGSMLIFPATMFTSIATISLVTIKVCLSLAMTQYPRLTFIPIILKSHYGTNQEWLLFKVREVYMVQGGPSNVIMYI